MDIREAVVINNTLMLGEEVVCVLNETPIRLIKSYICCGDLKATEEEKVMLAARVALYFKEFSNTFFV